MQIEVRVRIMPAGRATRTLWLVLAATLLPSCGSSGNNGPGLVTATVLRPVVGANQDGQAIVLWQLDPAANGGLDTVYFSRYAGGWSPSSQTFPNPSTDFSPVAVGLDSQQDALAVGLDSSGNILSIQCSVSSPVFQTPIAVASLPQGADLSGSPPVSLGGFAMNERGQAVIVWTRTIPASGASHLMAAEYIPGSGWSPAGGIESVSLPGASIVTNGHPQVALDDLGDIVVVWMATGYSSAGSFVGEQIWTNSLTAGVGWNAASPLSGFSTSGLQLPHFAGSPGIDNTVEGVQAPGGAMVLWNENAPKVLMSQFSIPGGWSAPQDVTRFVPFPADWNSLQVQMDQAGDATVVSVTALEGQFQTWGNYFSVPSGQISVPPGWGTPVPLAVGVADSVSIALAMDPDGVATVLVSLVTSGDSTVEAIGFNPQYGTWTITSPEPLEPGIPPIMLTNANFLTLAIAWLGQGILAFDFVAPPVQLVSQMVPSSP